MVGEARERDGEEGTTRTEHRDPKAPSAATQETGVLGGFPLQFKRSDAMEDMTLDPTNTNVSPSVVRETIMQRSL